MTNQTGPKTNKGKAVTRLNAVKYGVYSESPVLPEVESEEEWLEHHEGVFNDLQPDGYVQAIVAERIAINSWRLRRLVRYEREQVRNRQKSIRSDLIMVMMMEGKKDLGPTQENMDRVDRWLMDRLIPGEKEMAILSRQDMRLARQLRIDMLHFEHMKRQKREGSRSPSPAAPESLDDPFVLRQLN